MEDLQQLTVFVAFVIKGGSWGTGAVFLPPSLATGQILPAGGIGRTEHVTPHRPWLADALRRKKDIMTLALVQPINHLHQPVVIADAAGYGEQRRLSFAPAERGEQDTGLGKFDPSLKYLQRHRAYRPQQRPPLHIMFLDR